MWFSPLVSCWDNSALHPSAANTCNLLRIISYRSGSSHTAKVLATLWSGLWFGQHDIRAPGQVFHGAAAGAGMTVWWWRVTLYSHQVSSIPNFVFKNPLFFNNKKKVQSEPLSSPQRLIIFSFFSFPHFSLVPLRPSLLFPKRLKEFLRLCPNLHPLHLVSCFHF